MPADLGLFGPDSVTWRIHSDPASILGGGRALLIEALDPTTMAVFDQNTDYRADPWGRIRRTARYFTVTTFGTTAQAHAAGARLRGIHRRLYGVDPRTGETHRADEPELLLWVHATAVHSFLTAYRRYGGWLSRRDADRYVAEMVRSAELVGLPARNVPASYGELRDYLRGVTDLEVTPPAREGMKLILFAPPLPLPLRPAWAPVSAALIALLPRRVRQLYGLPWARPANPPLRATMFGLSRVFKALVPEPPEAREARRRARALAA